MKLDELLKFAHTLLDKAGAPHAVIGAFGMSAHGYQRATNDIDFLVDGEFRPQVEAEFFKNGFSIFNSNDEVLQLKGPGVVDLIFARRPLSKKMLRCSSKITIANVPVLDAEDIIGLKIQSLATNHQRKFRELGDIQALCQAVESIDWARIKEYADLFGVWDAIKEIRDNEEKND